MARERRPDLPRPYEILVVLCTGSTCGGLQGSNNLKPILKKACMEKFNRRARVSTTPCLGLCGSGPNLVVYPDDVWYMAVKEEDIEEIVEKHLEGGEPVERLIYKPDPNKAKE